MFERTKASVDLWRLRRAKRKSDARFASHLIKARALKRPQDEIEKILAERLAEAESLDYAIALIETLKLIEVAQKLRVPTPPLITDGENWVDAPSGSPVLTDIGAAKVREAVRAEQMARWTLTTRWIPILSALTGLLGVVVAILALILRGAH